jgi:hypothetical protein
MVIVWARHCGHVERAPQKVPLSWAFTVVGTGVDPVTSRFSAGPGTNIGRSYDLGKIANVLFRVQFSKDLGHRCYALFGPIPRSYGHVVGMKPNTP